MKTITCKAITHTLLSLTSKSSIAFLLFLFTHLVGIAQWVQTNGPHGGHVYGMTMVEDEIWAATRGGAYISKDGGDTWERLDGIPLSEVVTSISYVDGEVLMTAGKSPFDLDFYIDKFYKSTDKGQTWKVFDFPETRDENSEVFKIDDQYFVRTYWSLYTSKDDGLSWQKVNSPTGSAYFETSFDDNKMIASFLSDGLYLSEDKGQSWQFLDSIVSSGGLLLSGSDIYVIDSDGLHHSSDLGKTWNFHFFPSPIFRPRKIIKHESGRIYIFGYRIYFSDDDGETIEVLDQKPRSYYCGLSLADTSLVLGAFDGFYKCNIADEKLTTHNDNAPFTNVHTIIELPNKELFTVCRQGIFRTIDQGDTWIKENRFDKFRTVVRTAVDNNALYALSRGMLIRSTDNVNTFDTLARNIDFYGRTPILKVYDNKILIGTGKYLIESTDMGVTWDTIFASTTLDDFGDLEISDGNYIVTSNDGSIYLSKDNGTTWTERFNFRTPGVSYIYINKMGGRLLVCSRSQWFYSDDHGENWTAYNPVGIPRDGRGSLPEFISLDFKSNITIASCIDIGVFKSDDLGLTWTPFMDGLENNRTVPLTITDDYIFVGTRNGGVWRRGLILETISGQVYQDDNQNGVKDTLENPIPNIAITSNQFGAFATSDQRGFYDMITDVTYDTIRPIPFSPYVSINPPFYIIDSATQNLDFGIYYDQDVNDLSVTLTSLNVWRPGFDNTLYATVSNVGTTPQQAMLQVVLSGETSYNSALPAPNTINMDTLNWVLDTLMPFEAVNIPIDLTLDFRTMIGTEIDFLASVDPTINDENTTDNEIVLKEEVVGAYDPNDKQVSPSDYLEPDQLTDGLPLTYTIRFQNTGNFPAENVRIIDTLSEQFDITTFRPLSASHDYTWSLRGKNVLEFTFENIQLPDSVNNEPASHGFVKFHIRPFDNLEIGDEVENFADIYFDFNAPIRTNTSRVVYDFRNGIFEAGKAVGQLKISPNPGRDLFQLQIPGFQNQQNHSGKAVVQVFDQQGRAILSNQLAIQQGVIDIRLTDVAAGVYMVLVTVGDEQYIGRVIVGSR